MVFKKWGLFCLVLLICAIAGGYSWNTKEVALEPSVEISNHNIATEETSKSLLEPFMQSGNCLITEGEKEQLQNLALSAAMQVKELYKEVMIEENSSYGPNVKDFTREQRKSVVELLGESDFVSITEDTNMENYELIEEFYSAYQENRESMVTVFDVYQDGVIGVKTFIYREGKLQTYYVEIRWQEGGIPELKNKLVSDIKEMKLTEKGYFIYAYEIVIPHTSLRQYWRIKPLSDDKLFPNVHIGQNR